MGHQQPPQPTITLEVAENANKLLKPRHPQTIGIEFNDLAIIKTITATTKTPLSFDMEQRMFKS